MTRRVVLFAAATAMLIAAGLLGSRYLFRVDDRPDPPSRVRAAPQKSGQQPPAAAARGTGEERPEVVVVEVAGDVERKTAKGTGQWKPAREGDNLGEMELIRTGPGGMARLKVGQRSRLTVQRSSELSVREITEVTHRFRLEQGRLSVDYRKDGRRVIQIEGKDGATVARAKAARFSVLQTGRTVAVATETGAVDLSASGATVKVAKGQQSVVVGDAPPTPPSSLPKEVALKVARAAALSNRALSVFQGQTQPGNRVMIEGKAIPVDPSGRFTVELPLTEGKKSLEVVTEDAAGRRKRQTIRYFAVRSAAPVKDVNVTWGKKRQLDVTWGQPPKP